MPNFKGRGRWLIGMILQPTFDADGEYQRCGVLNVVKGEAREMIKLYFQHRSWRKWNTRNYVMMVGIVLKLYEKKR